MAAPSRRALLALAALAALPFLPDRSTAGSSHEPAAAEPAPLAAQYRAVWQGAGRPARTETWTFYRDAQRIALLKPQEQEVWLRDRSGVRLQRLFHADRTLVDYSAGELRTLRIEAEWSALATLFDERLLARLRRPRGDHWAGRLGDERLTLQWDPQRRLPVTLVRQGPHGTLTLTRLAVAAGMVPPHWPPPTPDRDDYDRLDAADFGDRADDPFVRRLLAREVRLGWRQHAD
jgi:hypothetical protein